MILGVDDMFVIIQCLDNLDDGLDPKEKVAQVSRKKYVQFIHCVKLNFLNIGILINNIVINNIGNDTL